MCFIVLSCFCDLCCVIFMSRFVGLKGNNSFDRFLVCFVKIDMDGLIL